MADYTRTGDDRMTSAATTMIPPRAYSATAFRPALYALNPIPVQGAAILGPMRATQVSGFLLVDVEDVDAWPVASPRATTSLSALALERATRPDLQPTLPEVEIDDGFGV